LKVFPWSVSSSLLLVGFVSSGSYSYPYLRPQSQQQFDQCDLFGRGTFWRAQSKPTHAKGISEQVRHRAAPTFQSVFIFSKRVLLSVPLELILID
jgi:hypothetical protein